MNRDRAAAERLPPVTRLDQFPRVAEANGKAGLSSLLRQIDAGDVDTVLVCMCDMQGRLVGKRLTARQFRNDPSADIHACDYLLAVDMEMHPVAGLKASSWNTGFGDFSIRPDFSTTRLPPWVPGTALVMGDPMNAADEPVAHAPRSILKRQIARLQDEGLEAIMASELEFYVFDGDWRTVRRNGFRNIVADGFYSEDYQVFQTTRKEHLMRAIRNGMELTGIPVECSKGEGGPGQAEINLHHAPALEMADRHVIYKNGVKELAQAEGQSVTFMAKWNDQVPGSSCHIHASLWKESIAAFAGEDGTRTSSLFDHWLAGQLALADQITLFLAPALNSYKRFQEGSFAPTKLVWSFDNRTAAFRAIGSGKSLRVECRVPGADVNPYLAYAALIAAGLHGVRNRLPLPPAVDGNAYLASDVPAIPLTLRDAAASLDRSVVMREAFGDDVVDHYLRCAAWEQSEFDRRVTDWELARYFERV